MPDIVERLIELIGETTPLEEKFSGVVASMIEKTANSLSRFEATDGATSDDPRSSADIA